MLPCAVRYDHRCVQLHLAQSRQQFQAVHAGHLEVGHDDSGKPLRDFFQALDAISRCFRAIAPAGNQLSQSGQRMQFVFNNQYSLGSAHGCSTLLEVVILLVSRPDLLSMGTGRLICNLRGSRSTTINSGDSGVYFPGPAIDPATHRLHLLKTLVAHPCRDVQGTDTGMADGDDVRLRVQLLKGARRISPIGISFEPAICAVANSHGSRTSSRISPVSPD